MSKKNKVTVVLSTCLVVLILILIVYFFTKKNHLSSSSAVNKGWYLSSNPSIALDSNDTPHLTWFTHLPDHNDSDIASDIAYVKQYGDNWVTANGGLIENNNMNVSRNGNNRLLVSSIVLDPENNPHFAWIVSSFDESFSEKIRYVKWDGNNWLTEDNNIYDPQSKPTTISNNTSRRPCIDIDSKGYAHLVWKSEIFNEHNRFDPDIMYIRWDGINWVTVNGEIFDYSTRNANASNTFLNPPVDHQFVLDSNDYPCLVWDIQNSLKFIRWNGSNWVTASGDMYNPKSENSTIYKKHNKYDIQLTIDSNDNPHIAWCTRDSFVLSSTAEISYLKWNGNNWEKYDETEYTPGSGDPTTDLDIQVYNSMSFTIDSTSKPHFVWSIDGNDIFYTKWNGSCWSSVAGEELSKNAKNSNISQSSHKSYSPDLALDSNDNPHIVWSSYRNHIRYIKWNGKDWVCMDGSKY